MAVVGALCLLNLVLTLAVIRRLREHTDRFDTLGHGTPAEQVLPAGATVGSYTAATTTGTTTAADALATADVTLVGFFSPGCTPCHALLPEFTGYAGNSRYRVLAVIVGPDPGTADTAELRAALEPLGDVVLESADGPLCRAFGVQTYPAVCLVDSDRRVLASGGHVRVLPAYVPA